jgi:AhpD family alkylhydroperoxidase
MEEKIMDEKEELNRITELFDYIGKNTPKQTNSFSMLMSSIEEDGKVSSKIKEAVALGIAIKSQCQSCIIFHTKKALEKGFSKEEILEIAWVAVLMGGGPSLMYMSYVKDALDEFSKN